MEIKVKQEEKVRMKVVRMKKRKRRKANEVDQRMLTTKKLYRLRLMTEHLY